MEANKKWVYIQDSRKRHMFKCEPASLADVKKEFDGWYYVIEEGENYFLLTMLSPPIGNKTKKDLRFTTGY